jgi:uncharacterized MAPEG superfamily protein
MISYILWGLLMYLVHIFLPPGIFFMRPGDPIDVKLKFAAGSRDEPMQFTVGYERAKRAQRNYEESLPFFLTLALLLLYTENTEALASRGAMVFLIARMAYLPTYVAGIPMVRTLVWLVSWAGLVMMGIALHAR